MDNNRQTTCSRDIFSLPIGAKYFFLLIISILALAFARGAGAESITLQWDPVVNDPLVTGYEVHYGLASGQYQWVDEANASGAATNTKTIRELGGSQHLLLSGQIA